MVNKGTHMDYTEDMLVDLKRDDSDADPPPKKPGKGKGKRFRRVVSEIVGHEHDTNTTKSQRAVETGRASYDALLLQNQQLSSANVQKSRQVLNPYAKKPKDLNPCLKKSSSRILTPVNNNKIHNPYRVTAKQSTMSREQTDIRKLRMEMWKLHEEACKREAEYRQKSREEAHEREVELLRGIDDYE